MTSPGASPLSISDLIQIVYEELRVIAAAYMQGERRNNSLQPTALVHEAYLALEKNPRIAWRSKTHFKAMAAKQMRRVLVDHARRYKSRKRGGDWRRVSLDEHLAIVPGGQVDTLVLDETLDRLAKLSERQSLVAEYKVFAGLTEKEIAKVLDLSERTVRGEWVIARTWLAREIGGH